MLKIKTWNNQAGFTLIELLAVVVIIGVLAALVVPEFDRQVDKAREKTALAELKSMQTVIDLYYLENGQYPGANNGSGESTISSVLQVAGINWTGDENGITDPWDNGYCYATGDSGNKYILYSPGDGTGSAVVATSDCEPRAGQAVPADGEEYEGVTYNTPVYSYQAK